MASTMKRETLKNIGNVPDWVLKQRATKDSKKETAKVVRPRTTPKQPKAATPTVAPSVAQQVVAKLVTPQPIKAVKESQVNAVQNPTGSKVRRIYSREFLIKFKYNATSFPVGTPTPLDIIAQYNKEFELRERIAAQESSVMSNKASAPTPAPATPAPVLASQPETAAPVQKATGEKKLKKKKEGEATEKNTFKLRLACNDDSILRSPLFRASTNKAPVRHASPAPSIKFEDKENPAGTTVTLNKPAKPSSTKTRSASPLVVKKETVKTVKLPTTTIFTPTPAPVSVTVAAPTPAPVPAPIQESIPSPVPAPVADAPMEDAKQDDLDVITKKLKNALKETDPRRLAQRQKQIEYGKATPGYQDYVKQVAKSKRKREDPKTPNKYQVCSKRSWDGQVRKWRRMLHFYDPADMKSTDFSNDDIDMDNKFNHEITEADLLAEENALRD